MKLTGFSVNGKRLMASTLLLGSGFILGQVVTSTSFDWASLSSSVRFYTHAAYYRGCVEGRKEQVGSTYCAKLLGKNASDIEIPDET